MRCGPWTISPAGGSSLGLGSGWFQRDYDEYGYEFGTAGSRLRALERDLPRFKARLGKVNPGPQGPMPILIGGSGEKVTLRIVAEHADMWHGFGDADRYRHKAEVLAGHCEAVGRDPAEIAHVWGVNRDSIEDADGLRDAGVTVFTVGIGGDGHGYDLGPLRGARGVARRSERRGQRERVDGRCAAPAQLPGHHGERPAAEAHVVDEQARAGRQLARHREGAAHVGHLLGGVGHLALGRPRRATRSSTGANGRPSARGEPRREVGHERAAAARRHRRRPRPRARPSARTGSAAASTSSSSKRPARRPACTSGSQPPSPSRASARPSSARTSSGSLRIAPSAPGAIFLTSSTSGRERRCSAAARTSAGSSGPSKRGAGADRAAAAVRAARGRRAPPAAPA